MGYPQHWLLSFGGHQGDVNEIWNCGIRMAVAGEDDVPPELVDEEAYLTDTAVPALTAWFSSANAQIAVGCKLLWCKFNQIAPDGTYSSPNELHERVMNVSGQVTSTVSLHPLQVSIVYSFRTDEKLRPPGAFGRIYSPRPAVAVDVNGDMSGALRVAVGDAAGLLLENLSEILGDPGVWLFRPSIVSAVGAGERHVINTVVIDSSLDIQRRRSNHQSKEITGTPVLY